MLNKSQRENKYKRTVGTVKIVVFLLLVSAVVILLKYFGIIPSLTNSPFEEKHSKAPSVSVETTASNDETFKPSYKQEYYRIAIDYIYSAKINNPDSKFSLGLFNETENGIPFLALQTGDDAYPIPNLVYYFDSTTFYTVEPHNADMGSTALEHFYFVKGTDTMVYRCMGNSYGTYGDGEQIIYHDFKDGKYSTESYRFSFDRKCSDDTDAWKNEMVQSQNAIEKEMDGVLAEYVGEDYELICYNDIAVFENQEDFVEKELNYNIM